MNANANSSNDSIKRISLSQELELAIHLAYKSRDIIQQIRKTGYKVWDKGKHLGQVTEADQAVSDFLIREIETVFPNDVIVSEESEKPHGIITAKRIWFIDPIDGTREFIEGKTEWSIMIGLTIDASPCLGVVYQPDEKKLYYAAKGYGAFVKTPDQTLAIQVSSTSELDKATLIQSRSHWSNQAGAFAQKMNIINILKLGSLGLKLAKIAESDADLYLNFSGRCHLWDVCAPEAILLEAGGVVSLSSGKQIRYELGDHLIHEPFFASNAYLFEKLCYLLNIEHI